MLRRADKSSLTLLPNESVRLLGCNAVIDRNPARRVVITGMGVIGPLGLSLEETWDALSNRRSGVVSLAGGTASAFSCGGVARDFSGKIDDFGPLDPARKRAIRKGLKLMCREIRMGVAAAQHALQHARLEPDSFDPDGTGVVYGCDHIVTLPEEFTAGFVACINGSQAFDFNKWGDTALGEVTPLWLLKYLPNMPASHIAIYNDLRGPNNSLTYREASSNIALGEAAATIRRGAAERIVAGATGCSISPLRSVQLSLHSQWTRNGCDPDHASRPFDAARNGMVPGEGAGALVLEDYDVAVKRGAKLYGELIGYGSSIVADPNSVADIQTAVKNAMQAALRIANVTPDDIGHVHAHGAGTQHGDEAEAAGIAAALETAQTPVTAAKSYFGNLGAAGGIVELVSSVLAMQNDRLFPILNCNRPDERCPIHIVTGSGGSPGSSVLNVNYTPQGQASAVIVRSCD